MSGRDLNLCKNTARDLLRQDNQVVAELVSTLVEKAYELGRADAKAEAIEKMGGEPR